MRNVPCRPALLAIFRQTKKDGPPAHPSAPATRRTAGCLFWLNIDPAPDFARSSTQGGCVPGPISPQDFAVDTGLQPSPNRAAQSLCRSASRIAQLPPPTARTRGGARGKPDSPVAAPTKDRLPSSIGLAPSALPVAGPYPAQAAEQRRSAILPLLRGGPRQFAQLLLERPHLPLQTISVMM